MTNLLISLVAIFILVFMFRKPLSVSAIFFAFTIMGIALYLVYTLMTGKPILAVTTGNVFFDIMQTFTTTFIGTFSGVGMSMIPIFGFSMYMNKIGAGNKFGTVAAGVIAKTKNPYFVGIAFTIILTAIMRLGIVSAVSCMALLLSTVYPVLLHLGMSRKTAITAIFLGTCFDWGPADFVVGMLLSGAGKTDIAGYFTSTSIILTPIILIIVSLISGFIFKWWDNKDGFVMGSDAPTKEENAATSQLPGIYALFPMLPLIFLLFFSNLVFKGVNISVFTATIFSIFVVLIAEFIRKKKFLEPVNDAGEWFTGMGQAFGNMLCMVAAGAFFAGGLTKIGGFDYIINLVLKSGLSGWILLFILGLLFMLMTLLLGSNSAAIILSFSKSVATIAESMGIPFFTALFPVQMAASIRVFNLGTGPHTVYCTTFANCTPMDILKRAAIPCVVMYLVAFFSSFLLA